MSDVDDLSKIDDGAKLSADNVPDCLDEFGRAFWISETPEMLRIGRLMATDGAAWLRYCQLVGRWWSYEETIRKAGEFKEVTTVAKKAGDKADSMWRIHPARKQQNQLNSELRLFEDRFGRTPLARTNFISRALNNRLGDPANPPAQADLAGDRAVSGTSSDPSTFTH